MNKPFYGVASMTASQRSQIINIENSQGPGMYNVNKQKYTSSSPKWSLKPLTDYGSCFKILKQNRPPPGSYKVTGELKQKVKLKNPNYRSQKYKQTNQKVAHMSDLNLPSSINNKTGASFGNRDELLIFKQTNNSPGPIYYVNKNIQEARSDKIKNNCKGFGFGQRNGIYKTNNFVPGPGAYTKTQQRQRSRQASPTSSTFGRSPRNVQHNTNPLGPGQYKTNFNVLSNSGRSFKLKGKLPQASKYINPNGPGTYDLPDMRNIIGPRFNHYRYKSNNLDSSGNQLPSPNTYQCKRYPEIIDQNKGFSLGKKGVNLQFTLANKQLPGPGAYEVAQNISKPLLGGYMGRKVLKKKKTCQQDCFGKYDPKFSASARDGAKFSFAYDAKPWNKPFKDQTLGPTHYQFKQKRTVQSYSMGKSQRFKQLKKQSSFNYQYQQKSHSNFNSTIGYMPSYIKKITTQI